MKKDLMNNQDVAKIAYVMGAKELAYILQDKYLNLEDLTINIPLEELKKIFYERFDIYERSSCKVRKAKPR